MKRFMGLFSLKNKTAIITGAGGGLGRQFALTLAEAGADLVLIDKEEHELEKVFSSVSSFGNATKMLCIDLANSNDIAKVMKKIDEDNLLIDVLINNAGVGGANPVESTNFDQALNCFSVDSVYNLSTI